MKRRVHAALVTALTLGSLPAIALAHGDESMEMDHNQAMSSPHEGSGAETYFLYPEYQGVLYTHISLMVVGWGFMLPVAVMLSLARSRHTFSAQLVFVTTNLVGLIFGMIYNENTPDLYPNDAHYKIGWAVTALSCAQVVLGIISRRRSSSRRKSTSRPTRYTPISIAAMDEHQRVSGATTAAPSRGHFSLDSGQGTEPNTASLCSQHDDEAARKEEAMPLNDVDFDSQGEEDEQEFRPGQASSSSSCLPGHSLAYRVLHLASKAASIFSIRVSSLLSIAYNIIDRVILILAFVAICTGVISLGRFFEGHEIFSGLAHWIKGGVFFWLGVLTLGRWAGAFAEVGWAWNLRPRRTRGRPTGPWRPSAEFVESALIFIYGSTNIFLEHLGGGSDAAWSAQDLEHVSITVLFIGGGLCGMLVESTWMRELLNNTTATDCGDDDEEGRLHQQQKQQGSAAESVSLNPIPALVILLLGAMMSSHTQHNMVSGMVHKQWGDLLKGASVARALSYVLMYLRPPRSVLPSRPPTELLAAFGLMAGGLIFMASSNDTIQGMVNQDLDAMLVYVVTMGLVVFLMAWILIVMAIKGWALRREAPWQITNRSHTNV